MSNPDGRRPLRRSHKAGWRRAAGITALTALSLPIGCGSLEGVVEAGIREELPRIAGPAARYEVNVTGLRPLSGEAERVIAIGHRVQPEKAPVLELVTANLRDVTYDRRRRKVTRVGSAVATVRVTAADLAAFLEGQRGGVRDVSVEMRPPDGVLLRARPDLGGLDLPDRVTLVVEGRVVGRGARVEFDATDVRATGFGLGGAVERALSGAVNPLVDLSGMPIVVEVTAVQVTGDAAVLTATGSYTGEP